MVRQPMKHGIMAPDYGIGVRPGVRIDCLNLLPHRALAMHSTKPGLRQSCICTASVRQNA